MNSLLNDDIVRRSRRGKSFEDVVLKKYGGVPQVAFINGDLCRDCSRKGASIADIVRINEEGDLESIECKSINPYDNGCFYQLSCRLLDQIRRLKINLPYGTKQRLVFEDFGFSEEMKNEIREIIWERLNRIYYMIDIDFLNRKEVNNAGHGESPAAL